MPTQTAERMKLHQAIEALPDDSVTAMLDFVKNLQPNIEFELAERHVDNIERNEPNERTIKAIEDSLNPANLVGPFSSVESLMESLLADDDA